MRIGRFVALVLTLTACASRDIEVRIGSPADTKAELAPAPEPIGALASTFDPERVAPVSAPAAGHDHHAHHGDASETPEPAETTEYTCPHHPEVKSDKPGVCPKCKMDLVPAQPKLKSNPAHDHGAHQ